MEFVSCWETVIWYLKEFSADVCLHVSIVWGIIKNVTFPGSCNHIEYILCRAPMKTNKKTCEVGLHFNRTPRILSDFTFQCIDQIQTNISHNTEKLFITKEASVK